MDKHSQGDVSAIQSFLSKSFVFKHTPPQELEEIAQLFRVERHRAGTVILRQGGYSPALCFLRSGRLAVRVRRGNWEETVAHLQPPAMVGELSFLTGRSCVANVEVVVDAELVLLPKEAVPKLPKQGEAIFRGLLHEIAGRLQDTVASGAKVPESPIVLLNDHPNWEAPFSFASELASSLAGQSGHRTLLVNLGTSSPREISSLGGSADACSLNMIADNENLRAAAAQELTIWKSRFENVLLHPVGPHRARVADTIRDFANFQGDLIGRGDPLPSERAGQHFVVQSAAHPTLPFLSCNHQLISDAASSESAFLCGGPVNPKFRRTVDSIARCIAGLQVGIVLGSGVAWGFAHIGVLSVLEEAKLPIDCVSGCSTGSAIGALRSVGLTNKELIEFADDWRSHHKRLYEWCLWRMCRYSEKRVVKFLRQYFGDRLINQTEIPFWANAVDIQTGKEVTLRTGTLVESIRASTALLGVLPPLRCDPYLLVDACIMNPVPVNLVTQMGCHFTVAANAVAGIESRKMSHRFPFNAFDIITRCVFLAGHELGKAHTEEIADVEFTLNPGKIGMLEFSRIPEIIERGRAVAEENLPAILASYQCLKTESNGAGYKSFRRVFEGSPAGQNDR